jgi:hypothetical protein
LWSGAAAAGIMLTIEPNPPASSMALRSGAAISPPNSAPPSSNMVLMCKVPKVAKVKKLITQFRNSVIFIEGDINDPYCIY